ncbi:MAG: hypothetical protein P8182_06785, partial [Deltaproteobacteria bacterium]
AECRQYTIILFEEHRTLTADLFIASILRELGHVLRAGLRTMNGPRRGPKGRDSGRCWNVVQTLWSGGGAYGTTASVTFTRPTPSIGRKK